MSWLRAVLPIQILFLFLFSGDARADQAAAESFSRREATRPSLSRQTKQFGFNTRYEYARVSLPSRHGSWSQYTNRLTLLGMDTSKPYAEITRYEREGEADATADFGALLRWDKALIELEAGWGMDTDYIYESQGTAQLLYPIVGNTYWKARSRYLHYDTGDVLIVSSGIEHYFGDNYILADLNGSATEDRDPAYWAGAKASVQVHEHAAVVLGGSYGERLFDILSVSASKQQAYLVFGAVIFHVSEDADIRAGYSYGEEKPAFIKRGFEVSFSYRF